MELQYLLQRDQRQIFAGYCIRISQHHRFLSVLQIINRLNIKILIQRSQPSFHIKKRRKNIVKSIGNIWKDHSPALTISQKSKSQHLVGAIAHKHLLRLQIVKFGNRLAQIRGLRIAVKAQLAGRLLIKLLQQPTHRRSWRIRIFIGVQLDNRPLARLRLLARCVRHQTSKSIA